MTSLIKVDSIQTSSGGTATASSLGIGGVGKIGQIQHTLYSTTHSQSISANTDTAVTGVTVNITPTSTDSKIFLFGRLFCEISHSGLENQMVFFFRDTTKIGAGTTAGSRNTGLSMVAMGNYGTDASTTPDTTNFFHIDSPSSTSEITYKVGYITNTAGTLYVNRSVSDGDGSNAERGTCEIIAAEILS